MDYIEEIARQLVGVLAPASTTGLFDPDQFSRLHRVVLQLRSLPLTFSEGVSEASLLSDLPARSAELLLRLVNAAGPREAATALFIAGVDALDKSLWSGLERR